MGEGDRLNALQNTSGVRRLMSAVEDIETPLPGCAVTAPKLRSETVSLAEELG